MSPAERNALIAEQLSRVPKIAARFYRVGSGIPFDELVGSGMAGLLTAADRFDPGRGARFATYAEHRIIGQIRHHLRDEQRRGRRTLSLNAVAEADEFLPALAIPANDEAAIHRAALAQVLARLAPRYRRALRMQAQGYTMADIAEALGICTGTAYQICRMALARARQCAREDEALAALA